MAAVVGLAATNEATEHPLHAHRRLDLAQLMVHADDPVPWIVERFAAREAVTTLVGAGGEGKSLLGKALAGGVLRGSTVAGLACERGQVAIFDAENGPLVIAKRIKHLGLPLDGLAVYDAAGVDLGRDEEWIAEQLDGVDLAIFDSLRTLAPGARENDSDDMAPVMAVFRRLALRSKAAVVVIHHRPKGPESDFRGSSAIRDQSDLMFVLARASGDPEGRWRRELRCAKCRIDEEPELRALAIEHAQGRLTLREATPHSGRPKAHELLAQRVEGLLRDRGPLSGAGVARELERKRNDGTLARAFELLQEEGRAVRTDEGWTVANVAKRRQSDASDRAVASVANVATPTGCGDIGDTGDQNGQAQPDSAMATS